MAIIQIKQFHFTYEGSAKPVFSGLDFIMDSSWRLGLVGRNGRGKTTLLRLLAGELSGQGQIISSLPFDLFPFAISPAQPAEEALVNVLAPYSAWEKEMDACLKSGTPEAIGRYGELEQLYTSREGYAIRERLKREAALVGIPPEELFRPFLSFSPGEQTRLMLAALFLRSGRFLLIDEPTNHLDSSGRAMVAEYLKTKSGFLAVSHDRDFLDSVCDHILALEKQGARVVNGNYSVYRENKKRHDEFERAQRDRILGDIGRLHTSAREKAGWSDRVEASKIGTGAYDRGYIGHQSAKMMKRAKHIEGRIQREITEKEKLLKNIEYTAPLKITPLIHASPTLLRFDKVCFGYDDCLLIHSLDLTVSPGERLAIAGGNGSGKTTLLKLMTGELIPRSGTVWRASGLAISLLPQTANLSGTPRDIALEKGLDLTRFLTLMRKFDMPQDCFDRDAAGFSLGQKKKLLLSLSLASSAHLYLWDEPLNDVDPESREQIEKLLSGTQASMVFIEHEQAFLKNVATRILRI